jgi:hypothetical protein
VGRVLQAQHALTFILQKILTDIFAHTVGINLRLQVVVLVQQAHIKNIYILESMEDNMHVNIVGINPPQHQVVVVAEVHMDIMNIFRD